MQYLAFIWIIYLITINFISVCVTVFDKYRAKNGGWRVKERTLLFLSAIGGSAGMYLTMRILHHKTRHFKFMLGIPLIFLVQLLLILILWGMPLWKIN